MKFFTFLLIFLSLSFAMYAQDAPKHEKGSFIDSVGNYYQQAELPLYIYVSHKPNDKPHHLKEEKEGGKNESPTAQPIYLDGHGKHYIRHLDAAHASQSFPVYADGIAPISKVSFINAPIHRTQNAVFYGIGLQTTVSARDEMSGVQEILQSINQSNFSPYSKNNYETEGNYSFEVYAHDKVGNVEKTQKFDFVVDLTAPATFHNITGIAEGNIISTGTKLYLTTEDNLSGIGKTFFKLDENNFIQYAKGTNINFYGLKDGEHTLTYFSIDNVNNKETEKSFTFYYDKTAPIMSADVLGDRFIVEDKVYFSGRTKLKLTAVDNKSGIKDVRYSINNDNFRSYEDPFYLPGRAGEHIIRYYAVDKMENEGAGNRAMRHDEYRHNVSKVYLDLTGPIMNYDFIGKIFRKGDSVFINNNTKIKLKAVDPESGLQYVAYNFSPTAEEVKYLEPFTIEEAGTKRVHYYGYDNVNNRNVADFVIVVDKTAPDISHTFSISPNKVEDKLPIYPAYVTLFLAASDQQVGFQDIRYKINSGKDLPYLGLIQGFRPNETYKITIFATDMLGNKAETEIKFKTDKY